MCIYGACGGLNHVSSVCDMTPAPARPAATKPPPKNSLRIDSLRRIICLLRARVDYTFPVN